ncbi:MAG TPA: NAD(P)H-dependent glycerol-3-phosphate dehydrogenase [Candidatus Nanopelagicaceae bacterium]|nr:NAD(P)H-dependent glycerol-3-phosphate dehydrogenase [Candidatus Nanopelagicaceae bacterium]
MNCAVIGGGSWGTAFAQILIDAGNDVVLWARDEAVVKQVNTEHRNDRFHPGRDLPESLRATADLPEAIRGADLVALAIPSQAMRPMLKEMKSSISNQAILVSLIKGVELETMERMSQVIQEVLECGQDQIAVATGPNLAGELIARQPAGGVVASLNILTAEIVQHAIATSYFRPYTSNDVIGCELAGAMKNVIALAVGMSAGLGMGDNTRATVITRGLAEMSRLGEAIGAQSATFAGLAGLGDLVATCSSPLSRNRSFGERLGQGMELIEAVAATKTTVEGVRAAPAILALARANHIEVPITEAVGDVLIGDLTTADAVRRLMGRSKKAES